MSPNYENTVIYKIISNDQNINDIYVGSTTDFNIRKRQHKTDCNNVKSKSYNLKVYQIIRQKGGWDEWTMIKIEDYPCTSWNEAHARERYYYDQLRGTMNTQTPNRTQNEYKKHYYELNKDKQKQYYEANKEKLKQYAKQRYQFKKERDNYLKKYLK